TVVCEIVLPVPPLPVSWRFPPIQFGPQTPRCHGEPEPLPVICTLPVTLLLQITLAPAAGWSPAPVGPVSVTVPVTAEFWTRSPPPPVTMRLPVTVTSTRSHHFPLGTVRFPVTVVAFSSSFEHVMLPLAPTSVAFSGRFAAASASPTHSE